MTHQEMLDFCRRWEEAWIQRDLRGLAECYADDAVVESPWLGEVSGRDKFMEAHNAVFAAFPDSTHSFEPPLLNGDRAAIIYESAGTHTGSIMGLAPTGRPFRLRVVFLLEFRDGRIVRDRRVYDFTGLLVQVGVLKAKPA